MRKFLAIAFSGLMVIGLAACDDSGGDNASDNPPATSAPAEPGTMPADPGNSTAPAEPGAGTTTQP
ncbi:hypothetical protein [Martelella endophytica]|uniref:Lipoprotein n=1 Tax=Martelella endophytica TaxID=1486262 RepID=A0A0D5LUN9_MAREN|nr:hypothetical protein [Martelella endophytica]AJY47073.1 hypothetical protein TM49_17585 [Martelella endophytica]